MKARVIALRIVLVLAFLWPVHGSQLIAFAARGHSLGGSRPTGEAGNPVAQNGERTPVLVELFTSEGCSSCPPADALVARLDRTQPFDTAEVILLNQHVDYWNSPGWRDRFSSRESTERQSRYAQSFGNDTVYTPQMVVDGTAEFVGSSEVRARKAISAAAGQPKGQVSLAIGSRAAKPGEVPLRFEISGLPEVKQGDTAQMFLAVTESDLHSDIRGGENAGLSITHRGVVRRLDRLGEIPVNQKSASAEILVPLQPAWNRGALRVVVFVQERESRRVLAAGSLRLAEKTP